MLDFSEDSHSHSFGILEQVVAYPAEAHGVEGGVAEKSPGVVPVLGVRGGIHVIEHGTMKHGGQEFFFGNIFGGLINLKEVGGVVFHDWRTPTWAAQMSNASVEERTRANAPPAAMTRCAKSLWVGLIIRPPYLNSNARKGARGLGYRTMTSETPGRNPSAKNHILERRLRSEPLGTAKVRWTAGWGMARMDWKNSVCSWCSEERPAGGR